MDGDPGGLALAFVNTVDLRWSAPDDRLHDYGDLLAWAVEERAVTREQAGQARELAVADPARAEAAFRTATTVRECLYRVLEAVARRADPAEDDLAVVNERLALCPERLGRGDVPGTLVLRGVHLGDPLEAPLGPVARSAAGLLGGDAASRLRACPGSPGRACGWLFVDVTKNGNRRYCVSGLCANRARASRHRARRRGAEGPAPGEVERDENVL